MKNITNAIANALITADDANAKLRELLAANAKLPERQRMTKSGLSAELRKLLGFDKADKKGQGRIKTRISRLLKKAGFASNHGGGPNALKIPAGLTEGVIDFLRGSGVDEEEIPAMLRAIAGDIVIEE
jgi:hypothetical protein